jgi:hypothetical protein
MRMGQYRKPGIGSSLALGFWLLTGLAIAYLPDAARAQQGSEHPQRTGYLELGQHGFDELACCLALSGDIAAVGLGDRIELVDLSRPDWPAPISSIALDSAPMALAGLSEQLFVVDASGDLGIYDLGRPTDPRRLGRLSGLFAGATDLVAEPGLLLVAHGLAISSVDISRPEQPRLLDSLTLAAGARRIASAGGLIVAAAGESGMLILDGRDPASLRSVGAYTVTGSALAVGMVGNRAYLTEKEYLPFAARAAGRDRSMPPVPMANRIHRVDLDLPEQPRLGWIQDAQDCCPQGYPELAVGPNWLHVASLQYAPGANVWQLDGFDLRGTEPSLAAQRFRGNGRGGWNDAYPIAIESDGERILVLEQNRDQDRSGSTLSVLQAPIRVVGRVWLPLLGMPGGESG